ncbi:cell surface protein [Tamlana sp. 2_MG-2023]|uniref:cell surface protein n=1 Tax=unclassified Tamlana TaxID=2614803 RepID=UPI0026E496E0|nr:MULTISPECIES: cell surface protein [unclassified Tamlana]MDO6758674.1 cell surface protein [Tamlana sp. 2_MG-2023]MDO6789373.1 cell surface protein [Tamlana sp. 1_MG-2023]
MKPFKYIAFICLLVVQVSCTKTSKQITSTQDYNSTLEITENEKLELALADFNFWDEKLQKTPNQFPYLAKAAASQTQIFNSTGRIDALIKAENYLIEVNKSTNYEKSGYLKALARNYISQHKFKAALDLLKKAEANGEGLKGTEKMLFDVCLELGDYDSAKAYLEKIRKDEDFDYLIRLSKWSDHRGDLNAAIKYLEKAKVIADLSNLPSKKQWVYTNLADYYGHAGEIKTSYNYYLKALDIDPNDAYAKKGIAWIVYSHEKNPNEALRILNRISQNYKSPDIYLLKSEIAEFQGDLDAKIKYFNLYTMAVENPKYGAMYNKYNALLYAEDEKKTADALKISLEEIENRPTPASYDLLAWTYFKSGDYKQALKIAETHVVGKTSEPDVLLHLSEIYKANGKVEKAEELKKELLESTFELGPLAEQQINRI